MRDYRTIRDPPDRELLMRAFDHGKRFAFVRALTVFKFNAAYRRNSYVGNHPMSRLATSRV